MHQGFFLLTCTSVLRFHVVLSFWCPVHQLNLGGRAKCVPRDLRHDHIGETADCIRYNLPLFSDSTGTHHRIRIEQSEEPPVWNHNFKLSLVLTALDITGRVGCWLARSFGGVRDNRPLILSGGGGGER